MTGVDASTEGAAMTEPRNWFLLLHTPGPGAEGVSVTEQPLFAEHFAFLQRMIAADFLIAAGPLADSEGDGLTVISAPSLEEARRLAEQDDQSVVGGLLAVTVRPWQVVLAPIAG
jgi:uncharacterized protein YciI